MRFIRAGSRTALGGLWDYPRDVVLANGGLGVPGGAGFVVFDR
jgi:hypothetical protein